MPAPSSTLPRPLRHLSVDPVVWSVVRTEHECFLVGHRAGQDLAEATCCWQVREYEPGAAEGLAHALNCRTSL